MPWRTERSNFPSATSKLWWDKLAILVVSEIAVRCLAGQHLFTSLPFSEIADRPLLALVVVGRKCFRAGGVTTLAVK